MKSSIKAPNNTQKKHQLQDQLQNIQELAGSKFYSGLFLVVGPPGTGKTSFLAKQINKMAKTSKPVVVSLTNTAAKEIAGRNISVPKKKVGTLHSLAYNSISVKQPVADIYQYISDKTGKLKRKQNLDDFQLPINRTDNDEIEIFQHIDCLRHRLVPIDLWPTKAKSLYESWQEWKLDTGTMDFTDMIEQAIREEAPPPGNPDAIIADELQDFSKLEYQLLKMWYNHTGCMIGCGDPWQSLYTWRGADPHIFLDPDVPEEKRRILHQSYRVPKAVHAKAIEWARQLSDHTDVKYNPTEVEGSVQRINANYKYPDGIMPIIDHHTDQGHSVMVMASCEYMLRPIIRTLRSQGRAFSNPWRPLNGAWNPLGPKTGVSAIQRILGLLKPYIYPGTVWTADELWNLAKPLEARAIFLDKKKAKVEKLITNKKIDRLKPWTEEIMQYVDTEKLVELGEYLQAGHVEHAVNWWTDRLLASKAAVHTYPANFVINQNRKQLKCNDLHIQKRGTTGQFFREIADFFPLYKEKNLNVNNCGKRSYKKFDDHFSAFGPPIYVGTIHSFKGAEADVVIILPDLSYQGYCGWLSSGPNKDAVVRMFYVALTRAKDSVYICSPSGNMAVQI